MTHKEEYEILKPKLLKAMSWLDNSKRSKSEVEKWQSTVQTMFDQATKLERLMINGDV